VSAQTTAEDMKGYLGGMGAAIGSVVTTADKVGSDDKRTWVVSSITASTVTLNASTPDGEETDRQVAIRDFIEQFSVVKDCAHEECASV